MDDDVPSPTGDDRAPGSAPLPGLPAGVLPGGHRLERVAGGGAWLEGPCWVAEEGVLVWSDIPADRICSWDPRTGASGTRRSAVEFTNGRTPAPGGGWYQCSHGRRAVELERGDGVSTVVDSYRGHRLNSPNDVVVASDGAIWFTDPAYGITVEAEGHPGQREYGGCWVFRLDPDGRLDAVATDFQQPNGLAFSPDESVLYVADTGLTSDDPSEQAHHVRAFRVVRGEGDAPRLEGGEVVHVCERGVVDGFRVDVEGRLWCSSDDAVLVLDPSGALLERVPVPERVSNACFGGDDGSDLLITASTSVYRLRTGTRDAAAALRASSGDDRRGALR
ncbi:SMP-30/gluconolactonase/LRE family protein [Quadrisphaera sp. INWT6]|uniref:SMP-30/gluconolactonase/LRE family protein n=1 Tax=Quadrisphaera sp. INWT6 TaxID=2596917 RepID=UPI002815881D|nr:SMP-30/gluconolactonase/LRE family protein [Quadrisphaera sp. INWT6]